MKDGEAPWLEEVEQDWGREADDRWVRVMADVLATGVWHRDGSCGVVKALPISRALGERIYRWQERYDRQEGPQEPDTEWEMTAAWPIDDFAAEGLAIARALKAALPGWTVIYLDLAAVKRHGGWRSHAPRELWEYEIAAEEEVDPGSSPG